jgi:hypothetical protein
MGGNGAYRKKVCMDKRNAGILSIVSKDKTLKIIKNSIKGALVIQLE